MLPFQQIERLFDMAVHIQGNGLVISVYNRIPGGIDLHNPLGYGNA